jgi:hypothetical protein
MSYDPFEKRPAFFPSVSAEIFFESEDAMQNGDLKLEIADGALDEELDAILQMADGLRPADTIRLTA